MAAMMDTAPGRDPSHLAVYESLRERIGGGQYAVGGPLPTEEMLQAEFKSSRYAVRQALRKLEEDGMISRRRGSGTTVISRTAVHPYRHVIGSRADLLSYAHETRMDWKECDFVQTDGALARKLGCDEAREWQRLRGVRYEKDGAPLGIVEVYVDVTRVQLGEERQFDDGPVYEWLEKRHGLSPLGLSQDIRARTLTPQEAELLDDRPGAGSLQIIRRYFDAANQIYLISINNYRSHEFVYNLRLQLR